MIAAVCTALVAGIIWYRARTVSTAALMRRLPGTDALVLYIDFARLRQAGLLQLLDGSKIGQDREYTEFVQKTDFNYQQDLDSALAAFSPTGSYLFLRGRFDWTSLRSYVASQDGKCYNSLCRLEGSTPERHISFAPLQNGLMGMAVSTDDAAAIRLLQPVGGPEPEIPAAPVWMRIPPPLLQTTNLGAGTQMFARTIAKSERIVLTLEPEGSRLAARINVVARSDSDASAMAADLTKATELLRTMIEREHRTPNPADWSGVLTAGTFHAAARRVAGYWPIDQAFIHTQLGQ
jgi:hypothetical protein